MAWIIYQPDLNELLTTRVFDSYKSAAQVAIPESQIIYIDIGDQDCDCDEDFEDFSNEKVD